MIIFPFITTQFCGDCYVKITLKTHSVKKRFYLFQNTHHAGLDPAGRWFSEQAEEDRLNRGDADLVQVIHTDDSVYGWPGEHGDIDVFINGGREQPGLTAAQGDINDAFLSGGERKGSIIYWGGKIRVVRRQILDG